MRDDMVVGACDRRNVGKGMGESRSPARVPTWAESIVQPHADYQYVVRILIEREGLAKCCRETSPGKSGSATM